MTARPLISDSGDDYCTNACGVSWAAIFAGTFVSLGITIILAILGLGLGLSIYRNTDSDTAARALSMTYIIWLILTQWIASGFGGYITGRLRVRWTHVHSNEVFFRDTAHGLVMWSLATVIMVLAFSSAASGAAQTGASMMAPVVGVMSQDNQQNDARLAMDPLFYDIDNLFRTDRPGLVAEDQEARMQAHRILFRGFRMEPVPEEDKIYLTQLVMARTGVSEDEARRRVNDTIASEEAQKAQLKDMAVAAQRAGTKLSIFVALSLIVGAFIASVAGSMGGRRRDEI